MPAPPIKLLAKCCACPHHQAVSKGVVQQSWISVVVHVHTTSQADSKGTHAHTTSQAVSKGAVIRNLHGVSPAQRTANSHLPSLLPSKTWLAFDRFSSNTIASLNFLSGPRCVDWILTGSNHQMMLVCCGGRCVFTMHPVQRNPHIIST